MSTITQKNDARNSFLESMHPELVRGNGMTFLIFLTMSLVGLNYIESTYIYYIPLAILGLWFSRIWIDPYKYQVENNLYSAVVGMALSVSLLKYFELCVGKLTIDRSSLLVIVYIVYLVSIFALNIATIKLVNSPAGRFQNRTGQKGIQVLMIAPGLGVAIGNFVMAQNPSDEVAFSILALGILVLAFIMSLFSIGFYKYIFIRNNYSEASIYKRGKKNE